MGLIGDQVLAAGLCPVGVGHVQAVLGRRAATDSSPGATRSGWGARIGARRSARSPSCCRRAGRLLSNRARPVTVLSLASRLLPHHWRAHVNNSCSWVEMRQRQQRSARPGNRAPPRRTDRRARAPGAAEGPELAMPLRGASMACPWVPPVCLLSGGPFQPQRRAASHGWRLRRRTRRLEAPALSCETGSGRRVVSGVCPRAWC